MLPQKVCAQQRQVMPSLFGGHCHNGEGEALAIKPGCYLINDFGDHWAGEHSVWFHDTHANA